MKTVALFFGGLSNEAEVSVMSAGNVVKYFDYKKYKLLLVFWDKRDRLFYEVSGVSGLKIDQKKILPIEKFSDRFEIALLMTHGRYGEDGVLQAILESQGIKYCGCGVLSSALCMDKAMFKNLMFSEKISQVKYETINFSLDTKAEIADKLKRIRKFSLPLFVKPANSGSSVGITKINKLNLLDKAVATAKKHDKKVIIEEGLVNPREIEVGVLGNEKLLISRPGELRPAKDFYDYEDKYQLGQAEMVIPAKLDARKEREIKRLAEKAYRLAGCQGFARVDFFIDKGKVYLNEINTLPGFTDISMFPMVMMAEGMSYQELINKIIRLAR